MIRQLPDENSRIEEYRPFAQTKLIVLDIDGTVVAQPDATVAAQIRDLYGTLTGAGVTLTIATGRTYNGARPYINMVLDDTSVPVILYNGAVTAESRGRRIEARVAVEPEIVRRIVRLGIERDLRVLAYDCVPAQQELLTSGSIAPGIAETVSGWSKEAGPSHEFNGLPVRWNSPERDDLAGAATAILIETHSIQADGDWLRERLQSIRGLSVTQSSGPYLEIRPKGANKATALALVANELAVHQDHVLAVGDNDNDVEMLEWAGAGIAVANATTGATSVAQYQSRRPAGRGVVELLRTVAHAKRYFRESHV